MIVDKKIMELIDSVFENQIRPIQKALLATEIRLYTNTVIEESQGQELPLDSVSNQRELLIDFLDELNLNDYKKLSFKEMVDNYLRIKGNL